MDGFHPAVDEHFGAENTGLRGAENVRAFDAHAVHGRHGQRANGHPDIQQIPGTEA